RAGGPAGRRRAPPAGGPGSTSRHATGDVRGEPLAQLGAEVLAGHRELDDGLDVVEAVARVVAPAPEDHAVHPRALRRVGTRELGERVGQLDLAPASRLGALEDLEDLGREHVAAG